MLKVVIADDEKTICSLISQLLDWEKLGFEIVGMAYTGVDAFELIKNYHPDVIISDIRMPGYDGLELIKKTKEAQIDSEFVMISGFKQFEYAQNAMKYGVKYYLLKPIEEDKLLEIIEEIKSNVLVKRERAVYESNLEMEIKETRDKMKKRFLTSMLYNHEQENMIDRNEVNREYRTNFKEGNYRAVFVKLDTNEEEEESYTSIIDEIEKRIDIIAEVCEEHITVETHSGTITLVNYRQDEEEEFREKLNELYEDVKKCVERFQGFSIVIGVGEKRNNFFDSNECIKTAIDAIKYRIRFNNVGIIYTEDYQFAPYDINEIVTNSRKNYFISKVESGDINGVLECIVETIRKMRYKGEDYSPVCYFDILTTYVTEFTKFCKRQGFYDGKNEERLKRWNIKMDNVKSEKKILEMTNETLKKTMEEIETRKKEKDIKPIRVVKQYIEEHFRQDINLGQLAELVDMNASYLSSVFKKETGMTYSEYLTHCRLENAEKMLVESNMSISEISEKCGYQDSRYFSKQFSKQIGLKPSEYRKLYS